VAVAKPGFGLLDDIARFILLIKAGIKRNGLAPLTLRPEILPKRPALRAINPLAASRIVAVER